MEPNFQALQLLAEVALGLLGFSAILIGLARADEDGFSPPDSFRVRLLIYSSLGTMFLALLPFALFNSMHPEDSWRMLNAVLLFYSAIGLSIFPRQFLQLRASGFKKIFPLSLLTFQSSILGINAVLALLMLLDIITLKANFYVVCLLLFIIQSAIAFVRTMFYRVH